ncbi:MAG: leucine-rich repeat protein [Lachnospiraceae bacterium]|nr:leucine-rich repeat protein [Lachnospiraceae bacterium]
MDDAYDTEESPWGHLFYYGFDSEENGWITVQAIVIEEGVTSIGAYAFALDYRFLFWDVEEFGAENAQPVTVTIADSVTRIGEYAFLYNMPDSITLSANVTDIGEGAFETVGTLKEITVSAENPVYCSVEGVLYNKEQTELICCPRGKEGTLVIPDTVTDLNDAAFYGCVGLTSISLPEGTTAIGDSMFYGCSGLLEVSIPGSVTKIGDYSFSGCRSLSQIELPANVTEIGIRAFNECSALIELTIPDGVTGIDEGTFSGCTSLSKITLPDSVTSIGRLAFYDCSSLVEITIPDSLTNIESEVFYGCTSLTKISVSEDNPVYSSQNGVLFNKDGTVLIMYPVGKTGAYVIPEGVTGIGDYAFSGCDGLTSVTIPDCVVDIGEFAFYYCMNLKTATLSSGITYMNQCAFAGCVKLTDIYIPVSVTGIGEAAFSDCRKLADVYYGGDEDAWSAVSIGSENKRLKKATFHYNTADTAGVAAFLSAGKISSLTNTASGIVLEWSEVSGADGYYVYRKTDSGKYKKIKTIKSVATVSSTDTAVKDSYGASYSYKVLPYVNGTKGTGEAQTIVRLTGTTITSVTNTASGKIKVKWTQVSDVTGYQVKIVSATIKKKVSASKKSVTLTGSFTEGKNYYVCIRTYIKVDGVVYYSAWSSRASVKITK